MFYHYTREDCVESIAEKGLKRYSEIDQDGTGPINAVLSDYRPKDLPDFLDREACMFLHPVCKYRDAWSIEVQVCETNLQKDRLYVADAEYAQRIWHDTVHISYSLEEPDYPLEESARLYWESVVPYEGDPSIYSRPELLYFGDIPPTDIQIATTLPRAVQELCGKLPDRFRFKRHSSVEGKIWSSSTQYCQFYCYPDDGEFMLTSKSGVIDRVLVEEIRATGLYRREEREHKGTNLFHTFFCK